jgi:mycothiol synthase
VVTLEVVNRAIQISRGTDARGELLELSAEGHDADDVADAIAKELPAGGDVSIWVDHPTASLDEKLATLGVATERDLYLMTVKLPLDTQSSIKTRPFELGRDEAAWVHVNNRAFAWHREQSGWTLDDVAARIAEPWFDPAGFLLHEVDGTLLGFCWTKLHLDRDPASGEIYVIAVDPEGQGRGLGRELTVAGLESIHGRGLTDGLLYVDADNTRAVTLYLSLGFVIDTVRRLYVRTR